MRSTSLVGIARVVLHNHELVLMLEPLDKGIKATALRYQDEIRDAKEYFSDIETVKVPKDMLELAEHILKTKRGHFDPSKFSDRYEDALKALIKAKQAGKPAPAVPERPSNVINLMDALRRSVRSERSGGEAPAHRGKQRAARSSTASRKRGAVKSKRLKRAS
jgi:DNA end-binding protein Ku